MIAPTTVQWTEDRAANDSGGTDHVSAPPAALPLSATAPVSPWRPEYRHLQAATPSDGRSPLAIIARLQISRPQMCDAGTRGKVSPRPTQIWRGGRAQKIEAEGGVTSCRVVKQRGAGALLGASQSMYFRIVFKSLKYKIIFQHLNREENMDLSVIYQDLK